MRVSGFEKWGFRSRTHKVRRRQFVQHVSSKPFVEKDVISLRPRHSSETPQTWSLPKGSGGADAGSPLTDPKLTVIAGDVTKKADVDKVFEAGKIDGVIVALGGKTSDVGETMLTDGTKNIIAAMKENNTKRLAVITSIGAGDSESQAPFFFKVLMWTAMKKIFHDKNAQEEVVRNSGLEYCIVRPGKRYERRSIDFIGVRTL